MERLTTNPLPLDAAARDELRAKAEAARDTMAYAACRVLDGEMDHEANAIASRAQGEFLHAVSSPDVILALLAAVERGAEDTRDAERYRFLRDNPLQLRAIDGNASFGGYVKWGPEHFDRFVDAAVEDAARATPTGADHAE